jgi:hypothetical protein
MMNRSRKSIASGCAAIRSPAWERSRSLLTAKVNREPDPTLRENKSARAPCVNHRDSDTPTSRSQELPLALPPPGINTGLFHALRIHYNSIPRLLPVWESALRHKVDRRNRTFQVDRRANQQEIRTWTGAYHLPSWDTSVTKEGFDGPVMDPTMNLRNHVAVCRLLRVQLGRFV